MVVLVALMAVLGAVVMAMVMLVAVVVMMMVMAAAAGRAIGVLMLVLAVAVGVGMGLALAGMGMAMAVIMFMLVFMMMVEAATAVGAVGMLVPVCVIMVLMPVMGVAMVMAAIGMIMVVGAALGLEGALDLAHRAALTADHLGQDMVVLDIDGVGGDLGRGVAIADMPGDAHQAQRVLSLDLDQLLRRSLDQDERAVLQLDGIAIVQGRRLVEVEQDLLPAIALERDAAAIAVLMVEGQGFDDPVLLDRGLADDGGGALHVAKPVACWIRGDRAIAVPPLRSPERGRRKSRACSLAPRRARHGRLRAGRRSNPPETQRQNTIIPAVYPKIRNRNPLAA